MTLNTDDLNVDTFATVESSDALMPSDMQCTGCDSGCGIIWP